MNSFKELQIGKSEQIEIIQELTALCFLRGEEVTDYDFEVWLDYWAANGYNKTQVLEMIELGKKLPKYGTVKLAIGDLITNWEKQQETINNLSWNAFVKCLDKYVKMDLGLLNKVSLEILGTEWLDIEDKNKMYNFLITNIEAVRRERESVEHENSLIAKNAVINVFERIKQETRLNDKAQNYIKSELIDILNKVKDYFLDNCVTTNKVYVTRVSDGAKIAAKDGNGKDIIERKYNGAKMLIYIDNEIQRLKKEIKNFKQ